MAKNEYEDLDAFLKDLKSDIEDTLTDEVLDEIKDIEIRHVNDDVYGVYSPSIYERRTTGGLDDPANIVGTVKNMSLEVDNTTTFNPGYGTYNHGAGLADLVNDGNSMDGYFYDYYGEFVLPRPFLDNTIDEVEDTNTVDDAFEKGMKKRGYKIK